MTDNTQYSNNPFKIPLSTTTKKSGGETEPETVGKAETAPKKESEIPLEPLVRIGYEVPKSIRKQINTEANERDMEKKDIAHALLEYALKHKDKINFLKYKK